MTFYIFFLTSPRQSKRPMIYFDHVNFSVVKSNEIEKKYNTFFHSGHIIQISQFQKRGRHKCHTVTFLGFCLPRSIILFVSQTKPPWKVILCWIHVPWHNYHISGLKFSLNAWNCSRKWLRHTTVTLLRMMKKSQPILFSAHK